jgi:signal transduction histidine kinase
VDEQWWRKPPVPVLVDATLAVAVAGAVVIAIQVSDEPVGRPLDVLAYLLGVVMGALLLVRRRWPLGVLFATSATLMTYYWLDYPGMAPAIPLAAALFTAAAAGRFWWTVLVAAGFVIAELFVRWLVFGMAAVPLASTVINEAALLTSIVLLGETLRSRRERLELAEAEREREATRRVTHERLRIAREMHDVLGQTIAAVTVQAGLAGDILDARPAQAREALQSIRQSTRQALRELKAVLTVLRGDEDEPLLPGIAQLDELLDVARKAGLRVEQVVSGEPWQVPAALDLTAYRVVQESLTNTIRHANATTVTIELRYEPDALMVEVNDDGSGGSQTAERGFGLVGMAERVSALHGVLDADFRPDGGFRVHVRLPVEAQA